MVGYPHLFEDLRLSDEGGVEGIKNGLKIMGKGTFKFKIEEVWCKRGWGKNVLILTF
jgi:hypothetical protein